MEAGRCACKLFVRSLLGGVRAFLSEIRPSRWQSPKQRQQKKFNWAHCFVEFSHIVTQKCPKNLLNTWYSPSIGQQNSVVNLVR